MRKNLWNIRIPTVVGIILILVTLVSTSYLANIGVITVGRASPTQTPEEIRITNLSDTSFTVSYKTQTPMAGSLNFGKDKNLGQVSSDAQDKNGGNTLPHTIHYFTVNNLSPSTTYFFSILSGGNIYLQEGVPFQATTFETSLASPAEDSMTGKIVSGDGTFPQEGIVYVKTQNNPYTISTLLSKDGTYLLNIALLRNQTPPGYITLTNSTLLEVLVISTSEESNIAIKAGDTHPVPTVILSQNYDFSRSTPLTTATTSALLTRFQFPSFSSTSKSTSSQIITPKSEETFKDSRPVFSGTASPGAIVKITIHSEENIQDQTKADSNGKWVYRPQSPLSPGTHTISVTSQDQSGITKSSQQTFIVFASGSQFTEPSVSPIQPTPTPIKAPTPTNFFPTLTPTSIPPTPTKIPIPTQTPIPTLTPHVSTSTNIPPPGNSSVMVIGVKGAITTLLGVCLFLLTRGALGV